MIKWIDNGAAYLPTVYSGAVEYSAAEMPVHKTCNMDCVKKTEDGVGKLTVKFVVR